MLNKVGAMLEAAEQTFKEWLKNHQFPLNMTPERFYKGTESVAKRIRDKISYLEFDSPAVQVMWDRYDTWENATWADYVKAREAYRQRQWTGRKP